MLQIYHAYKYTIYIHTVSQSQAPSSGFWKALALSMPRKVVFHSQMSGDPQTLLQGDSDPMLTVQPDYLDCRPDPDPAGDLGKKLLKELVHLLLAYNFLGTIPSRYSPYYLTVAYNFLTYN